MLGLSPRRWRRIGLGLLLVAIAIQFVPYGRDHNNPPATAEPLWDSPSTRELAKQACFDCHSNETEWPAYASVAPVSWLIQRDVAQGRAVLNFSEWQRPQEKAGDAVEEVRELEMPPVAYRLMHSQARLGPVSRHRLVEGLARTLSRSDWTGDSRER